MRSFLHAAVLLLSLVTAAKASEQVAIATSNPGSLHYNIATAIARAGKETGLRVTVQPATSANQYLPYIASGGIDFGISNLQEMTYALAGEAWWQGLASPDLRLVGLLMPLRIAIFVRADSDIEQISDLKGRYVTAGFAAQNTIAAQLRAIYAAAGMTDEDVLPVQVPSVVAGADAFMSGKAEAFVFAIGAGRTHEAAAAVGGLRALPVPEPHQAALERARELWPTLGITRVKGGKLPGVAEDTVHFAFPQALVTHKNAPDEAVEALARLLHRRKPLLVEGFGGFRPFDPEALYQEVPPARYHPAAQRYYEEAGLE
jgi:TRAP transporter TAXI family solute receptor